MSYREASAELARALAQVLLVPTPAAATATELRLLAAYRTDVLSSLSGLHRTLLPAATGAAGRTGVADLERAPVATLGALLAQHPRGPASELAPTERLERTPDSPLGRAWRDAARHALLAEAAADQLQPRCDSGAEVAWAAVADLAVAVEAFAVAEADLGRLAAADPSCGLSVAIPAGLRLAAAECGRVARGGPLLPVVEELRTAAVPVAVAVVSGPEDLPDAQLRVLAALQAAPAPSPPLLARVAVGQARAALAAARVLRAAAVAEPQRAPALGGAADALTDRAGGLADIAAGCDRVRSLHAQAGLRAVHQTGEVMRHLQRLADTVSPTAAAEVIPAILGFARTGGRLVAAMEEVARGAVAAGDYLVPDRSDSPRLGWVPAHLLTNPPPLLEATAAAAGREPALRSAFAAPEPQPAPAGADADDDLLRRSLADRVPSRPFRPDEPTTGQTASRWWQLCAAIDPRLIADQHWPALAAALIRVERAGTDVAATLSAITEGRPLPDPHPARSLHYRLVEVCEAALTPLPPGPPSPAPPRPATTPAVAGAARHRRGFSR